MATLPICPAFNGVEGQHNTANVTNNVTYVTNKKEVLLTDFSPRQKEIIIYKCIK